MPGRYVLHTAPTLRAISVADVAAHALVTNEEDYPYIDGLILKATDYLQKRIGRQLLTATWKLYLDSFPDEIELEKIPVVSVTITYVNLGGTTQTLAASGYQTDLVDCGLPARIAPAYGTTWPSVRSDTYNAICVTFVAGWTSAAGVSQTIKHALLLLVTHWYENREPVNIGNIVNQIPCTLEALIAMEDWNQTP